MRYNKIIHLISTTITQDEWGNEIETRTERKVFANENSIGSSEYYNAASQGLRPEVKFEIRSVEYDGEKEIKFDGTIYNIIRSQKMGARTILTCERVNGDV
ncbi:SPP1 family predicted phage head-tail adaptor [Halanaerobium saccharolyticum]|jgi:SPP1 family predicted phage head-tail adaptor|uniref:SPP1 family predicted phage head-tail adaptor n=1 Tax=Halanaerobium saccharolyticum TaxID=43595 RepID=A0A4R6LE12_9FIRM|nr:phage head closure protein [Halanaerobium saccharolyticum]TDO77686.1 SPP1 family predicted phage head-tail adaptor [Halanaerobium saccharolyticum]